MIFRASFNIVSTLSILALSSACSKVDDMHDATMKMSNTTEKMKDSTEELKSTSGEMKKTTDKLAEDASATLNRLTQGDSLARREQALKELREAKTVDTKLARATTYLMAFEFQLWNHHGKDTEDKRLTLFDLGVTEFFRSIEDLSLTSNRAHIINPATEDTDLASLHALAAVLHKINPLQEEIKKDGLETVSMLTLIKNALKKGRELERGLVKENELPEYIRTILNNEYEDAVYLLQLRYNMLPAIIIAHLTNLQKDTWTQKLSVYFSKLHGKFHADFTKLNDVQIADFTEYLEESIKTKDFLMSLGIRPVINQNLQSIFKNMIYREDIEKGASVAASTELKQARAEKLKKLSDQIEAFIYSTDAAQTQ